MFVLQNFQTFFSSDVLKFKNAYELAGLPTCTWAIVKDLQTIPWWKASFVISPFTFFKLNAIKHPARLQTIHQLKISVSGLKNKQVVQEHYSFGHCCHHVIILCSMSW